MNELIEALLARIRAQGLRCAAAFSAGKLPRLTEPLVVADYGVSLFPAAFGDCFGRDASGGYRLCRRAEHRVFLDIYAPYPSGGSGIGAVVEKLLPTLREPPSGCELKSIQVGRVTFSPDCDCFRCTVCVRLDSFAAWEVTA